MRLESFNGGHKASKSSRDPKIMDYSPRKRPEMPEITSFDDIPIFVYPGSRSVEIVSGAKKNCVLLPMETARNDQIDEFWRRPKFHVTEARAVEVVHGAKKPVCYNPRKRLGMTKSSSFDDVQIFVYPGSWAIEIVSGGKNCVL